MYSPSQGRRAEEKLGRIVGQLGAVRRRLNSLALQYAVFLTLAMAIAAGAIVYSTAYLLPPLGFLVCAAATAAAAAAGLVGTLRTAWRMRANSARAAEITDERAGLKGRAATIVAFSQHERRSPLWSYLLEDTIGHREKFAAARIQRRRLSPAIYALAASIVLAALAVPLSRIRPAPQPAARAAQEDLTVDLDQLQLRAAEPGDESGMEVSADAATMRKLADKIARAGGGAAGTGSGAAGKLADRARDMGERLQGMLTGRPARPRLNLRLADSGHDLENSEIPRAPDEPRRKSARDAAGQFNREHPDSDRPLNLPPLDSAQNHEAGQPASGSQSDDAGGGAPGKSRVSRDESAADRKSDQSGEQGGNGGATHGVGADPDSLFGAQSASKLGAEGFEIAIEARPLERGAQAGGHAYQPPRVRAALSASQQPDEPVARSAVPADDQATVKRVFDR